MMRWSIRSRRNSNSNHSSNRHHKTLGRAAEGRAIFGSPFLFGRFSDGFMPFSHVPKPESRAAMISLGVSVVLLAIKFTAYFATGSAAIFSDAMESIVNVAAGVMALYVLRLAHIPADASHPYGHGKAEFLSAGLEGGMILLAAVVIGGKAVDTLFRPDLNVED